MYFHWRAKKILHIHFCTADISLSAITYQVVYWIIFECPRRDVYCSCFPVPSSVINYFPCFRGTSSFTSHIIWVQLVWTCLHISRASSNKETKTMLEKDNETYMNNAVLCRWKQNINVPGRLLYSYIGNCASLSVGLVIVKHHKCCRLQISLGTRVLKFKEKFAKAFCSALIV